MNVGWPIILCIMYVRPNFFQLVQFFPGMQFFLGSVFFGCSFFRVMFFFSGVQFFFFDYCITKEGMFSQEGGGNEDFNDRIEIQKEISELLNLCFKDKKKLNFKEFKKFNEETSSDMLVTILGLLKDKLP
jgi:hypothetical protein